MTGENFGSSLEDRERSPDQVAKSLANLNTRSQPAGDENENVVKSLDTDGSLREVHTDLEASIDAGSNAVVDIDHDQKQWSMRNNDEDPDTSSTSSSDLSLFENSDGEAAAATPHSDPLIDSIGSRIKQHLIVAENAVQKSHMVKVPQGYQMTEAITPDDHFRRQRFFEDHVKRKRDEGILTLPLTIEQYGFRADEINSSGAISIPNCQPCNLTNEIYPLLRRSQFDDTPDAIYNQLAPALHLASMFLTQPACMQYWVTLALGERKYDSEMSKKLNANCHRIDRHVQMTAKNIAMVVKDLETLAFANVIHFVFRNKKAMPSADRWACSTLIQEKRESWSKALTRSLITLHADYYTAAEKLSRLKYPEPSQVLRFSFNFAVLILHELAHSVNLAYREYRFHETQEIHPTLPIMEPYFMESKGAPECGRFMEQTIFGGEVHPINYRVDGSHGLCTSDWPPRSITFDAKQRIWYTVPMDYIQSLFLMKTWHSKAHLRDYKTFHIPRTGATAMYMTSFTTMKWSESDEAIKALALAEAQLLDKKSIPAPSYREIEPLEECKFNSHSFGKIQAARMEKASRLFRDSYAPRRHTVHEIDVAEDTQPPKKRR